MAIMLFAAPLLLAAPVSPLQSQDIRGREMLGLRIGSVFSRGELRDVFGGGSEIELHFEEGILPWMAVGFALSSHNFGDSNDRDKNIDYISSDKDVSLRIYSVTVSVVLLKRLAGKITAAPECGLGLYSINASTQLGFYEGYRTDNQLGLYAGMGFLYGLTNSVFLNLSGKYHYVLSGSEREDPIYFYTGRDSAHIYQIAVGVTIFTG